MAMSLCFDTSPAPSLASVLAAVSSRMEGGSAQHDSELRVPGRECLQRWREWQRTSALLEEQDTKASDMGLFLEPHLLPLSFWNSSGSL